MLKSKKIKKKKRERGADIGNKFVLDYLLLVKQKKGEFDEGVEEGTEKNKFLLRNVINK